ncbi:MAG: Bacterial type II secretion system protein F domain protein [Firmicutes bacterium ADurb.Bin182]|nr:MAG: Bacterial type II secretion system protein F domain protein [Firmicutes bacterium ADurb.Bin182]
METLFLVLAVTALIFLVCTIFFGKLLEDRLRISRKLDELTGVQTEAVRTEEKQKQRRKNKKKPIKVSRVFAQELASAGIRMRAEEFLIGWIALVAAPTGLFLLFDAHPVTVIAVLMIGLSVPPVLVNRSKAKRLVAFEKQLGDALVMMGNSLKTGMTFQQAMAAIGEEMPDPLGKEFTLTVREIKMGVSIDIALENMLSRVKSMDLRLMVSAILIQRQVGGNLSEILENISATIRDRLKLKDDIRVMTATGRISALVVGLIPIFICGILMLLNPEFIMKFFETTIGITLLVIACIMEIIGFIVIKKVVTIKY